MMHGGGPRMYREGMNKYPEPWVDGHGEVIRKKPTFTWLIDSINRRLRNPGGSMSPKPKPKPKEKSEIELYLERIGHVRR